MRASGLRICFCFCACGTGENSGCNFRCGPSACENDCGAISGCRLVVVVVGSDDDEEGAVPRAKFGVKGAAVGLRTEAQLGEAEEASEEAAVAEDEASAEDERKNAGEEAARAGECPTRTAACAGEASKRLSEDDKVWSGLLADPGEAIPGEAIPAEMTNELRRLKVARTSAAVSTLGGEAPQPPPIPPLPPPPLPPPPLPPPPPLRDSIPTSSQPESLLRRRLLAASLSMPARPQSMTLSPRRFPLFAPRRRRPPVFVVVEEVGVSSLTTPHWTMHGSTAVM